MTAGLFYVYTEPGSVDEAEFHDWYDHEHGPARLTVPGVGSAYRYRALDEEKPSWLALYELESPAVVDSPEYKALSANASDRDRSVAAGLATLDRRVYEQVSEDGSPAGRPTPVILAVAMSVPEESEDDLAAWYTEEHIPMLLEVPGWRRIRRFRLVRSMDAPGPDSCPCTSWRAPRSSRTPVTWRRSARPGATGWWPLRCGGNDGCSACATRSAPYMASPGDPQAASPRPRHADRQAGLPGRHRAPLVTPVSISATGHFEVPVHLYLLAVSLVTALTGRIGRFRVHTGGYGLMSADGVVQPSGQAQGHTPTWPVWSGPVPPLADGFTVRPDTVPDLETTLIPGATVALVPGQVPTTAHDWRASSGKTQLARYFAESLWRSPGVDVLTWVVASSRASVLSGFVQAAAAMGATDVGDAESVAARFVDWLSKTSRPWLVVLDDLREAADLRGLWPVGPTGRLLITTANPAAISAEHRTLALPVPAFSTREAMSYLSGRLGTDPDQRSGAIDLVGDLGCEPIALAQASAVITSSGMSCRDYRQYFTQRQKQLVDAGRAEPSAAAVTWTFSAEYAEHLSPGVSIRALVAMAALLDGHGIPGAVFTTQAAGQYLTEGGAAQAGELGGRPAADLERDPQPEAGGADDHRPAGHAASGPDQPGDPGGDPCGRTRGTLRPGGPGRRGRAARGVAPG